VKFASNYDLNVYRGCEHRCRYCFAQYSQKYLESDFFEDIYVKTNLAEVLDRELSRKSWKREVINISGVCDCYQPLEGSYRLMPDILRVLIKHRNPVFLLTKSPLILRDYSLLEELSSKTQVSVATTITTLDETIRQKIEPNACSSAERMEMLREFTRLECETVVMLMPIIPFLTDSRAGIEAIYEKCWTQNLGRVIPGILHLRGELKEFFYRFLGDEFPEVLPKIEKLYGGSYVSRKYSEELEKFLRYIRTKYRFPRIIRKSSQEHKNCDTRQLSLFEN
ncbi:MAG: radical SAM protein, partial [Rickettsiales bacterium]|nr:radical SAM protein [Rickettsiales bacterium]